MTNRSDAVFIRKSTQGQDEAGQMANVRTMLREVGASVPEQNWFVGTVSRRKLKENARFNHLIELVETDRIGTVYVESQDRWGTADRTELFTLLGVLRSHDTRLYDLRAKRDLTDRDISTELLAIVNSIKSEKELQDIAWRSLRTRVNNFKDRASWPTGPHPFGYGKACNGADGRLLWVWQPTSRTVGQIFTPDANGNLQPGPVNRHIPRKGKQDKITLVLSNNSAFTKAVELVFELYTRVGLSRRQIAVQLNQEGYRFYARPFTHSFVTQILKNPAYAGDIHFGKTQTGELFTFDRGGMMVEVKRAKGPCWRPEVDRIIKQDCHQAIVNRCTWRLAQDKLAGERVRTSFAPRNSAYYLKQLLVCGHCGKSLIGRTENDAKTGNKRVGYVCPTYLAGRSNGLDSECGYHFISHEVAERLLMEKLGELNRQCDLSRSVPARVSLQNRLAKLGQASEAGLRQLEMYFKDGVKALADYLVDMHQPEYPTIGRVRNLAFRHLCEEAIEENDFNGLPLTLAKFRRDVIAAEESTVREASSKLAELTAKHARYTLAWAEASDRSRAVLKEMADNIELEIQEWQPRTVPLTARLNMACTALAAQREERDQLLADWPVIEAREKGESLRRMFKTVTLYWDRTFVAASPNPTRPRKTDRPGRHKYQLRRDQIGWALAESDLGVSW